MMELKIQRLEEDLSEIKISISKFEIIAENTAKSLEVLANVQTSINAINSSVNMINKELAHSKELVDGKIKGIRVELKKDIDQNRLDIDELKKIAKEMLSASNTISEKIKNTEDRIKDIEEAKSKVIWGVLSAVGMAIMGLVIKN